MPIDPNIALGIRPVQMPDALDSYGKALTLKSLMQQQAMAPIQMQAAQEQLRGAQLQNQQHQQAITDDQGARDLFANNPNASPQELLAKLGSRAIPIIKSQYEAEEARLKMGKEKATQFGAIAGTIKDEASFHRGIGSALSRGVLSSKEAGNLLQLPWNEDTAAQVQQIAQQSSTWVEQHDAALKDLEEKRKALQFPSQLSESQGKAADITRSNAIKDLNGIAADDAAGYAKWAAAHADLNPPAAYSPDFVNRLNRSGVPADKVPEFDINSMKSRMGIMGNSEYDQYLSAYAQKLGKTPVTLSPDEKLKSFTEFAEAKKDPVMRGLAIAQGNLANALKQMQLDQMPTKETASALADDIINHRIAPDQISQIRGRGNGALGLMIYDAAKRQDPNFNWEEATATYQLAKSPTFQNTVRYMDSVSESIPMVIDRANKLANGNIRSLNELLNAGRNQFNDIDLKKFRTDATLVADEIAKILQGGGTGVGTSDAKLKQAGEILNASDSPAAIAAALGDVKELIGFRRKSLTKGTYLENATSQAKTGESAGYLRTADGPNGHKIGQKADGGWYDLETGKKVQ